MGFLSAFIIIFFFLNICVLNAYLNVYLIIILYYQQHVILHRRVV